MRAYFSRRFIGAVPLLIGIAIISFVFMNAMPGGPRALYGKGGRMTDEQRAQIRVNMGLDQPMPVQLGKWLLNLTRGDLGVSIIQNRPVGEIILERLEPTLRLVILAIALSIVLALVAGISSALWRYSFIDHTISTLAFVGLAMPVFWLGLMLQLFFAVQLGWLPSADMTDGPGSNTSFFANVDRIILPALTLALGTVGAWSRYIRTSMLEVINQDYIRTARAKGLREVLVIMRHTLRNALIPFVTVIAIDIPFFLTGAVVTEKIFSWPGLGRLFFDALGSRDYPVLMGLLIYAAVLIVRANILADLVYAWLDPRIKYK